MFRHAACGQRRPHAASNSGTRRSRAITSVAATLRPVNTPTSTEGFLLASSKSREASALQLRRSRVLCLERWRVLDGATTEKAGQVEREGAVFFEGLLSVLSGGVALALVPLVRGVRPAHMYAGHGCETNHVGKGKEDGGEWIAPRSSSWHERPGERELALTASKLTPRAH